MTPISNKPPEPPKEPAKTDQKKVTLLRRRAYSRTLTKEQVEVAMKIENTPLEIMSHDCDKNCMPVPLRTTQKRTTGKDQIEAAIKTEQIKQEQEKK